MTAPEQQSGQWGHAEAEPILTAPDPNDPEQVAAAVARMRVAPKIIKQRLWLSMGIVLLILVFDQWLKLWVKTTFELGEERMLIGNWARLHFLENNGIAFGLEMPGSMGKVFLTLFRMVAAGGIFYLLYKLIARGAARGLIICGALVFAGAVGNIIDCIFYGVAFQDINAYTGGWLNGRVVDMFYFPVARGYWPSWLPVIGGEYYSFFEPIFNLADASISVGIFLILLFYRRGLRLL